MLAIFIICFAFSSLQAEELFRTPPAQSLHLKRISEFWKDKDFATAKTQIVKFLEQYPTSPAADSLQAMLGDLHFLDGKYEEAVSAYEQIQNGELAKQTLVHQTHSFFELSDYPSAIESAEEGLTAKIFDAEQTAKLHFFLAESLFRLGVKDLKERNRFFNLALSHYESLGKTGYENLSQFPLAEIYQAKGRHREAAELFSSLADKYPEKRETLLFQKATCELQFDKEKALQTFGRVSELQGDRAKIAFLNKVSLLYEAKRYEDLVLAVEHPPKSAADTDLNALQFYVGKSYFALGSHEKAASVLQKWVASNPTDKNLVSSALITLISCAKATLNDALYKTSMDKLLEISPEIGAASALHYDRVVLLVKNKKWVEGREAAFAFLTRFQERKGEALSQLIHCSHQLFKGDKSFRTQWIADLKYALQNKTALSDQKNERNQRALIHALYSEGLYEEAASELTLLLQKHPGDIEAILLATACAQKLPERTEAFVTYATQALASNDSAVNHALLHLELYNAHLKLQNLDKAALHLFECLKIGKQPVDLETKLWLANYGYERAVRGEGAWRDTSLWIYSSLFGFTGTDCSLEATFPHLETEVLKFSSLLAMKEQPAQQAALLEALVKVYESKPENGWKCKRRALFELAGIYEKLSEKEIALKIYDELCASGVHPFSYFSEAALLQKVRLEQGMHDPSKLPALLTHLKDLQIRKNISFEPVHLEAALTYIDLKGEDRLFLLNRMREDFLSDDTEVNKLYHTARSSSPEQAAIFADYMHLIDALIADAAADQAMTEKQPEKAAGFKKNVKGTCEELLTHREKLHPDLLQRTLKLMATCK
jgi:tetratricopeptide (TPR) repeat protein